MHLQRVDYDKPIQLSVLTSHFAPTGVVFGNLDLLCAYIGLFLLVLFANYEFCNGFAKQENEYTNFGKFPDKIVLPYDKGQLSHLQL